VVATPGTEDVFFVESLASARKAFDTIIGKVNLFGEVNAKVLVQVSENTRAAKEGPKKIGPMPETKWMPNESRRSLEHGTG
jgi:hypothetical protein